MLMSPGNPRFRPRTPGLRSPSGTVRSLLAVITALNEQVTALQGQVEADFGRHPDAEIYLCQPGLGPTRGHGAGASPAGSGLKSGDVRGALVGVRSFKAIAGMGRWC
jgi:hypothetical protein